MLLDWLKLDGGALLSWWLLILLSGVAAFPLMFRLMGGLPSRGYMLARAAGLVLIGFLYWLLNAIGLLQNTPGSILLVWVVVFAIGVGAYIAWPEREPIGPWLRAHWGMILAAEILFAVMFLGWAAVRALHPEIATTEKPMEMAFLSATRRSAELPPHDPWMAGYDISYYYFGYVIMSMLAQISGVSNGVAFTLTLPTLFSLTGLGTFGVVYDLVTAHLNARGEKPRFVQAIGTGLLSVFFITLMGNLALGLVEVPYQLGVTNSNYLSFWDLKDRQASAPACQPSDSLDPIKWATQCNWWWFSYSRIVYDRDLNGSGHEIIDEMPIMSWLIFDDHPHALALPFAVLIIGLGFNLVSRKTGLSRWEFLLYAVFVGAMIFLNSWDAVYIGFIIGAEALRRLLRNGIGRFTREDILGLLGFAVALVGAIGILYLPFFIGFRSQAGGILPNLMWPTRFTQFFLFFGAFLIIILIWLIMEIRRAGSTFNGGFALQVTGTSLLVLFLGLLGIVVFSWLRANSGDQSVVNDIILSSGGLGGAVTSLFERRIGWGLLTELVLLFMLYLVIGRLFVAHPVTEEGAPARTREVVNYSPATGFVLLLVAAAAVLALAPDFVYLKDGFGNRMNTVFKLYYQAWTMWSIAGGFAAWSILLQPEKRPTLSIVKPLFAAALTVIIIIGLIYPVYGVVARAWVEGGHAFGGDVAMSLDGSQTLAQGADDYNVIQCLSTQATSDKDVVLEATKHGLAYAPSWGRVSALSGIPTLTGWDNHEGQWRGPSFDSAVSSDINGKPAQNRIDVTAQIYNAISWDNLGPLIKQYGITYIYVGPTERSNFDPSGLDKFTALTPVCKSGQDGNGNPMVAVYSVSSIAALNEKPGS
jgi:YYY domain-containing protein